MAQDGIREREITVERAGRSVPGLLWTPAGEPAGATGAEGHSGAARRTRPLVLIGHGGSGSKRQDYVGALVRRVVGRRGFAAVAIDGPVHGDRRDDRGLDSELVFLDFAKAWSSDPAMTDEMVADWRAVLDAVQEMEGVGTGPVGYWGLSMGTILGLPLVAAEPRISAAVLGLMGLTGPTQARLEADAPRVRCPVLFLLQWDDSLFPRQTALALFDALGSEDKRLHASPGGHGEVPGEEFAASEGFLARHLAGPGGRAHPRPPA